MLIILTNVASAAEESAVEWIDEDHYTLALDAADFDLVVEEGGMTWQYDGQQEYQVGGAPWTGGWQTVPAEVLTGLEYDPDAYLGVGSSVRVDAEGRRWLLVDVDLDAIEARIADYDALVEELYGKEEGVEPSDGVTYPEDAGESWWTEPYANWNWIDCSGGVDTTNWLGDPLSMTPSPLNERERKVVVVWTEDDAGDNWKCSGVMVDDDTVLTAAHCVTDDEGYGYPVNRYLVCTYGNISTDADCERPSSVTLKDGPPYSGDVDDDAVLLDLEDTPDPAVGWMALSQAGDNALDDVYHRHRGYPGYPDSSCSFNLGGADVYPGKAPGTAHQYRSSGPYLGESAGVGEWRLSSGGGMSGGAIYYCPTGDCGDGHYLTGIEHGAVPIATTEALTWQRGPLARNLRSWVIAHM